MEQQRLEHLLETAGLIVLGRTVALALKKSRESRILPGQVRRQAIQNSNQVVFVEVIQNDGLGKRQAVFPIDVAYDNRGLLVSLARPDIHLVENLVARGPVLPKHPG